MIELIRASAVPSNMMQSAARGALAVPPAEMVEILVYLAMHTKIFAQQASMTLAGWDEASVKVVAADPETPREVLDYLISPKNLRPMLLPMLLENGAISDAALMELAVSGSRQTVEAMMQSARVRGSAAMIEALRVNPNVLETDVATPVIVPTSGGGDGESETDNTALDDAQVDEVLGAFLAQHQAELKAEGDKPFQPIGGMHEESVVDAEPAAEIEEVKTRQPVVPAKPAEKERISTLQKIARLDISGRIQLAMKGTKEERSLLVRDGTKLVALAVLDSPKVSDGEIEKIASQKNVLEAVLRTIPMRRRFMKNYIVVRNLVFNPRTPMDVSLGLVKNLLPGDLKNLSGNKEVSDTVRKAAYRLFKQKIANK